LYMMSFIPDILWAGDPRATAGEELRRSG
jgi:hypothetical protein